MSKEIKCLDCGSKKLTHYKEFLNTEYRPITQNGYISKKKYEGNQDTNFPWGIICDTCHAYFDYEEDKNGKIIELKYK